MWYYDSEANTEKLLKIKFLMRHEIQIKALYVKKWYSEINEPLDHYKWNFHEVIHISEELIKKYIENLDDTTWRGEEYWLEWIVDSCLREIEVNKAITNYIIGP